MPHPGTTPVGRVRQFRRLPKPTDMLATYSTGPIELRPVEDNLGPKATVQHSFDTSSLH
jgi:hypothetical protein